MAYGLKACSCHPLSLMKNEKFLFTNHSTSQPWLSAKRNQFCTMQNEQATQDQELLPRIKCTSHGPECDVLVQSTPRLKYTLFRWVYHIVAYLQVGVYHIVAYHDRYFIRKWTSGICRYANCIEYKIKICHKYFTIPVWIKTKGMKLPSSKFGFIKSCVRYM